MTRKKKQVIDQVIEQLESQSTLPGVGDSLIVRGKVVRVVEVLPGERFHVKNQNAPFDSFIIGRAELEGEGDYPGPDFDDIEVINPDLLYRPDDRITL